MLINRYIMGKSTHRVVLHRSSIQYLFVGVTSYAVLVGVPQWEIFDEPWTKLFAKSDALWFTYGTHAGASAIYKLRQQW